MDSANPPVIEASTRPVDFPCLFVSFEVDDCTKDNKYGSHLQSFSTTFSAEDIFIFINEMLPAC